MPLANIFDLVHVINQIKFFGVFDSVHSLVVALLRHYFGQKPNDVFHHTLCLSNFKAYGHTSYRVSLFISGNFFIKWQWHFLCFLPNMTHWSLDWKILSNKVGKNNKTHYFVFMKCHDIRPELKIDTLIFLLPS